MPGTTHSITRPKKTKWHCTVMTEVLRCRPWVWWYHGKAQQPKMVGVTRTPLRRCSFMFQKSHSDLSTTDSKQQYNKNYSTIQINFLFWVEYNSTHCLPPPEAFILIGHQLAKINLKIIARLKIKRWKQQVRIQVHCQVPIQRQKLPSLTWAWPAAFHLSTVN